MTQTDLANPFEIKTTGDEQEQTAQQPELEVTVPQPTTGAVVNAGSSPAGPSSSPTSMAVAPIPRFEGAQVMTTVSKLTGSHTLDAEDSLVLTMDDRVRLIGEYRVTKVGFETNKNGDLIRVQTLTAIEVERCPYNPADPNDDGVWHSRPQQP